MAGRRVEASRRFDSLGCCLANNIPEEERYRWLARDKILRLWLDGKRVLAEKIFSDLVHRTVQQVLEAEMTSFLRAETYQRNDVRRGWRNGYKPRILSKVVDPDEVSNVIA